MNEVKRNAVIAVAVLDIGAINNENNSVQI